MRKKATSDWVEKTDTVCLIDWAEAYLDFAKVKFIGITYREKKAMFRRFFRLIPPDTLISELTPKNIMDYVLAQNKERSGYATNKDRKNFVAAWNWGMKYMDSPLPGPNPCLVERMPEVRHPRYVPPEEDFWKVYNVAEGQDKVMLSALFYLGARCSEIFNLLWVDVDFGNNLVRLKTQKRRDGTLEFDLLPMTAELRKALLWWWENRPIKIHGNVFICDHENLMGQEHYGQPFKKRRHLMSRLCDKAGVKRFGFHAIRHLTATSLYHKGYGVEAIQAAMRHKHATTTNQYVKTLGLEQLRTVLEDGLSHPKGKIIEMKKVAVN
jgi:integrase